MTDDPPDIDLGHGVTAKWLSGAGHDRAGLLEQHPRPDTGAACYGTVLFDLPGVQEHFGQAVWQVTSLDPLDISPSVLCRTCGHHGFIRAGRWVPA